MRHGDMVGSTLWEIGSFKDVAASQSAFRHLQNKEYIRYENLPLETKHGEKRQVEFVSNVYLVDGKRVIQCNVRDITDRYNAEASAQKAHQDLVALVEELRQRDGSMQLHQPAERPAAELHDAGGGLPGHRLDGG